MQIKLPALAALLVLCMPVSAQRVDVTNDPNKDFFDGYERVYKRFDDGSACSAAYAKLRSGAEQIGLNQLCEGLGITEKQIYDDLMKAMKYVQDNSSAKSFSRYFRLSNHRYFTDEPQNFCIFRDSVAYVFTSTRIDSKPGWKIISTSHYRPGSGSAVYGLWKIDQNGTVIAQTGLNKIRPETITIPMQDAVDCQTTKPYVPGLLLPSD